MSIKSIKIDKIKLSNFMTFNNYQIDNLSKYKIIFICGHNAQGKSTITSEAPYFTFFNKPLRYSKIEELLAWGYDHNSKDKAFAELSLNIIDDNNNSSDLIIKRNIIGSRYKFDVSNNDNHLYDDLYSAKNITSFNNSLKDLLDINESIFSILYLKSPFSQVIFDSNSELLSKITKSEYINELRNDFRKTCNELKINIDNLKGTIEKQNQLTSSIKKQLNKILDNSEYQENKSDIKRIVSSIEKIENELNLLTEKTKKNKLEHNKYSNKKNELKDLINKINLFIRQLEEERKKMLDLINKGQCYTCKQPIEQNLYNNQIDIIEKKIKEYRDYLLKNSSSMKSISDIVNRISNNVNTFQNDKDSLYQNIRKLSNLKASLNQSIINHDQNKKNNHDILKKIRETIINLNDELSIISADYKIISGISKLLLAKNSEYINEFYNKKIYNFNLVFKSILTKLTNNKFNDVKILLNNKPILNDGIQYKALSTSERKFIDISFVIAYIVYLSTNLKFKTFILDEFFDNYDKKNIIHIYNTMYEIAKEYDLQLLITTNKSDYLFNEIEKREDIKIITL